MNLGSAMVTPAVRDVTKIHDNFIFTLIWILVDVKERKLKRM